MCRYYYYHYCYSFAEEEIETPRSLVNSLLVQYLVLYVGEDRIECFMNRLHHDNSLFLPG